MSSATVIPFEFATSHPSISCDVISTSSNDKVTLFPAITMSKEANSQLAIRQEKFIRDLKNALFRVENKTYGICKVTG